MREYIDVTGRTEEEAIQRALAQLNLERDDVSVELLERAKSGFLGFGSCPAKVRVYYGTEEEPVPAPAPVVETVETVVKPEVSRTTEKQPEKKAPKKTGKKMEQRPASQRNKPDAPALSAPLPVQTQDFGKEVDDEKARAIQEFLTGLLERMGNPADVKVYLPEEGRYKVILEGENMGALIGRRGETLDAIQQLTSYSVNRAGGSRVRIQLDTEGYREKREQSLQRLARKVAGKVVKYRRNIPLEPMNAYERHVIHTALQEFTGVTTYSTGVEPNRRVIVAYDKFRNSSL